MHTSSEPQPVEESAGPLSARPHDGRAAVPSVLVVNDVQSQRTVLHYLLEPLDLDVDSVESGEAALTALLKRDYSAILLDIHLPGIDGFRVAELIRARPRTRETPILFITASANDEVDQDRGYALGAADFLFGPPRPSVLRAKVSALVRLSVASREAIAANAAKSEFMSLAAHELKTPIGVIAGYISMLRDGSLGPVELSWEAPLGMVAAKVDELAALVNDLLLVARLEAGEIPTSIEVLDVRELVSEAVARAQPLVDLRGGEIDSILGNQPVSCLCDQKQVGQILDNLINNAINYSPGKPQITLSVSGGRSPRISVRDHGAGIPESAREKIFERMARFRHAGLEDVPGTGLGLYLSRILARRQHGDLVLAESEVGVGSRFEVTLRPMAAP